MIENRNIENTGARMIENKGKRQKMETRIETGKRDRLEIRFVRNLQCLCSMCCGHNRVHLCSMSLIASANS